MRYLTYRSGGINRLGSLQQGYIVDVERVVQFDNMLDLIEGGPEVWKEVAQALLSADLDQLKADGAAIPYRDGLVVAPIPRPPKNVICLGRNYFKHYLEGAVSRGETVDKPPEAPIYFTKPHTSVIGPFDPIPLDSELTQQYDWEAELGVIIGVGGKKISREHAMQHVFGFTVINDLSARDLQYKHQQWFKGKGLDGSCPMGPYIVTPDELPESLHMPIGCKVNGEVKQEANTGQLMFDILTIIADLSAGMTLEPGDVISTGTPDGVGHFRKPPEYLSERDVVETYVEGVGSMRNRVASLHRAEVVATYNRDRDYLLHILSLVQTEHYDLPTVNEGWTVRDLIAHLSAAAVGTGLSMQRQLEGTLTPGLDALHERNSQGITTRKESSITELVVELVEAHYNNIDFYLSLGEEQVQVQGPMASGAMVTIEDRLLRASNHYRVHGDEIAQSIGLKVG
jgi:2-keto-4-pentenoate hydratase/2-oxohepta-3-ene-1,7-dioic acid hydratase in catechol pathway